MERLRLENRALREMLEEALTLNDDSYDQLELEQRICGFKTSHQPGERKAVLWTYGGLTHQTMITVCALCGWQISRESTKVIT